MLRATAKAIQPSQSFTDARSQNARLLSRPSPRLFSHVSCHICRLVSGNLSRHGPRHVSRRVSPLVTSVVTTLAPSLVITFYHVFHHVSPRASRHDSVTSPVLSFVVFLMSGATTLLAFLSSRVSSRLRDLKMCSAPRRKRFNPAKVSLCDLNMCTAPQRDRFDPLKVRRGCALRAQNAHRATARATRPAQSSQRVHFAISQCEPRRSESDSTHPKHAKGSHCDLKMCTAPQRERFDPTKVRGSRVHFAISKSHHATARVTRPIKVLRLPRNLRATWKVLRLPRDLREKL